MPFIAEIEDKRTIFQQDNAAIHTAATTKKWIQDFGMELLPWPVFSSDLNPIDDRREILARKVYDQEKLPIHRKYR